MEIKISKVILETSGVNPEILTYQMQIVMDTLGKKGIELIGTEINSTTQVQFIYELAWIISKIKDVPGFDRWKKTCNKEQLGPAISVARLTASMKDFVSDLHLEPPSRDGTYCDFSCDIDGIKVFFECKLWKEHLGDLLKEHQEIAEKIMECVDTQHQISITYNKCPTKEELSGLICSVNERLTFVRTSGDIILNDDFQVNVIIKCPPNNGDIPHLPRIVFNSYEFDIHSQIVYPNHIFIIEGRTVSVAGPMDSFKNDVKRLLNKSSKQAPIDAPFVLAIDAVNFQGEYKGLYRYISSELQPKRNTRFSGVLVSNIMSNSEDYIEFIPNAFAKRPVPSVFHKIVTNINKNEKMQPPIWERFNPVVPHV